MKRKTTPIITAAQAATNRSNYGKYLLVRKATGGAALAKSRVLAIHSGYSAAKADFLSKGITRRSDYAVLSVAYNGAFARCLVEA